MEKDQFAKKYGFYSYEEMLSGSGKERDQYGTVWVITPLPGNWLVWVDSFPETLQARTVPTFQEARKYIHEFSSKQAEEREQDGLSNLIKDYSSKISATEVPGLKRAYEISMEMVLKLQQEIKSINGKSG